MTLCFARPTVPVITKIPFGKSLDSYKLFFAKPPPTRRPYMSSPPAASPPDLGTVDEPTSESRTDSGSFDDVLVQYVVLRRDLIDAWPLGSVITQGCHASVAAVWIHRDHAETLSYCSDSNLDHMHKVCLMKCMTFLFISFFVEPNSLLCFIKPKQFTEGYIRGNELNRKHYR